MRKMISYYTWIVNRHDQFARALPISLKHADADCEFVILDLGSTDGLEDFVRGLQMHDERVRYYQEPRCELHFARLYNRVADLCCGKILVSLDADNYLGPEFCNYARKWCTDKSFLWASDFDTRSGTYGRIGLTAKSFWALGGYDEGLKPVGYQDVDLVKRARAFGLRCRHCSDLAVVGGAFANHQSATIVNMDCTLDDYASYQKYNFDRSHTNIAAGRLVANQEN